MLHKARSTAPVHLRTAIDNLCNLCYTFIMIQRTIAKEIRVLAEEFPIIAILGPRQSGKTTLAKQLFESYSYVSLEDIDYREFAENDPRGFLNKFRKNVIIDEIQRVPSLISYLQTHVDALQENGKVVITGSHNFLLMEQISQSLAGRVGISKLLPFTVREVASLETELDALLYQGAYPRIYDQNIRAEVFYKNYISTYIEKDIRQIKNITKQDVFMKFMRILAGRSGQVLNLTPVSDECGVSHNTIKEWLSILEASFLIYRLKPYHKNYNKRLIKNPKIYFIDTGLVCSLLGIRNKEDIDLHFMKGSIFETFVVSEFLKENFNCGERFDLYYWRDNHQKEMDLIIDVGRGQRALEIKSGKTIQEKHFSGLKYWKGLTGCPDEQLHLIYGGQDNLTRNGMKVVGWSSIFREVISGL